MRTIDMNEIQQVGGGFSENVLTVVENGETSYVAINWQGALELAIFYNFNGHNPINIQ